MFTDSITEHKSEVGSPKSKYNFFAHHCKYINEHSNRQIRLSFRFGNKNSSIFSFKKFQLHGNSYRNWRPQPPQNLSLLQEPMLRIEQVWNNWEQLRCVALSILMWRYDLSKIKLFGNVFCQYTESSGIFCVQQQIFQSLDTNDYQCLQNESMCHLRKQNSFWKTNKVLFFEVWARDLPFWRDVKTSSRCYWRYGLSWKVLLETWVCLCHYMERKRWKLLRMS